MALSEADKKFLTDAQQKAIIEATTAWNIAKRNNDQAGMDAAAKRAAAGKPVTRTMPKSTNKRK